MQRVCRKAFSILLGSALPAFCLGAPVLVPIPLSEPFIESLVRGEEVLHAHAPTRREEYGRRRQGSNVRHRFSHVSRPLTPR